MKLSNLFNDFVRVAQGLRRGSARPAREWLKSMTVLALLLFVVSRELWGTNFNTTYNYAGQGTSWSITNATATDDTYYKTSDANDCVVTVSGIFTGKTITSNVVITLDVACFGNGSNPTSSKFSIFNSSACTSQVTASQSGTLPNNSTYRSTVYTISQANATAGFTNDLAIKIAAGTKLIRFRSFTVTFTYTAKVEEPYTVRFYTASGTYTDITEGSAGAGVTPPSMDTPCDGWSFQGWSKSQSTSSTSTTVLTTETLTAGKYYPSANTTLYPVYTKAGTASTDLTIVPGSYSSKGTSSYGSGAERTASVDGISFGAHYITGNATNSPASGKSAGTYIQCQASNANIYNKSAFPGSITKVVVNQYAAQAFSLYCGSSQLMASSNTSTGQTPSGTAQLTQTSATQMTWNVNAASNYTFFDIKKGSGTSYISSIVITYLAPTTYYYSYPTCCTPLASINGSISSNSATSVTLSWSAVTGAEKYQVKVPGSSSHNAWTDVNSTSVTVTKSCGTAYTAYFRAIDTNGSHCSTGPESTLAIPAVSYTVTKTGVTNVTSASLSAIPATTCASGFGPITITAATGYALPADITVTNATKSWNSSTGALSISSVTGNVSITITPTCVSPVIGTDPASASYSEGASPSALTVAATLSSGTLTYQWQKSTDSGSNWSNESGTGYNTATYAAANISTSLEDDGVQYRCIVGNSQGGCTVTSGVATITVTAASQCVAPTFSVAAGTYNSAQTVTISSTTPGSTIYYTTNGDEPTTSSSHGTEGEASASVTVSSSLTLKAKAFKDGLTASEVSDAAYVICSTDPSFSTTSSSNITITGARVTCAGITKGTCDIDAYGIVYGTSSNPTGNAQQKGTDASTNVSNYYVDLTGLTDGTTYYARPYATVNGKTVYGTQTSFTTLNIPVITVSETSRAFGTKKINGSYEMTFTVSGNYLQGNIGLAVSGTNSAMFSVDETSLTPSDGSVSMTTITVTYTPSATGSHSASVSITSTNATTKTVTLSGTGRYEDTYMTAMHEGVTAWSSYASGVIQTGTGYSVPNPGDIAIGDREGTNCEGKHYHFAGWVEDTYKDSPSGHIVAASGTKDANNKTFWAVWEKESGGASSSTSITSYEDGDYYIVDTRAEVSGGFFALNGAVSSDAIAVTDIRSAVTENALTGTITIDVTDAVIADAMKYRLTTVGDSITIQHISTSTTVSQKTNDTKFETTGTRNWTIAKHSTDNRFTIQSWFNKNGNKTSCLLMQYSSWDGSKQVLTLTAKPYNYSNMGGTAAKSQNYMSGYVYLVPAVSVSYEDPRVECVCSAIANAGTAALNTAGTFSASQIDVKANDVSAGTDCEFTDYGFVWSSSVTTPTLVEGTGAASTNCTKIQVDDEGTVTSFTGSITGSFSAGNPIYFRSYVKNGKADGTYQYSDVVTVTPRSVTFNLNGRGSSTPAAQLVNNGSKATDPSYSESVTGYIFGGWYKEEGCSNAWNFASDVVSGGNKILYAKWTPITYSVRFNDNDENYLGTASGEMSNESYDYDESKALTTNAFSLAGYDFAGWALTPTGDVAHADKASVSNLSSTNSAVVDLYAIWTAKTYDVTLAATNETSSVGSQTVTATYNAAMPTTKKGGGAVAAPTRTGYTFTGWEYSSTTYYNYNAGTSTLSSAHVWDVADEVELSPKWSINSYTLTWNLDGGTVATAGTGASAGATGTPSSLVEYNSAITVPTVTKAGYNFNGWDVSPASNMPASNTTYTATWTAKPLNNIILAQTEAEIYDQQYVQIDVTYDPADIVTKGYTLTGPALTKVVTTGSTQTQLKISATKAGVTISSTVSETVSIKANADNSKTASVTVTINPLPRVHFVDNIHGETFSDVVETIVANALSGTKTTPTHSDVSDPGVNYNSCERGHLHLLGWIESTWADEHPGATHSQIIEAGSGNYYAAGASINVETHNGDTFYAVWSKIE